MLVEELAVATGFCGTLGAVVSGVLPVPAIEVFWNCAVASVPSAWLVTARPTYTLLERPVRVTVARCVQFTPSGDMKPRISEPSRRTRTQTGAAPVTPVPSGPAPDPATVRCWSAMPFEGVTSMNAKRAFAASVSRSITPALVQALVLVRLATRAVISPSPFRTLCAKKNSSLVPQMSAPDPLTVKAPVPPAVREPAAATAPISAPVSVTEVGGGGVAGVVAFAAVEGSD
jgi:hypothetical protein